MVSYQDGASSRMAKLRNSRIPPERRQRQATFAELVCAYEYGRLDRFPHGISSLYELFEYEQTMGEKAPNKSRKENRIRLEIKRIWKTIAFQILLFCNFNL